MTSGGPQTRGFLFADLRGYSAFTERHGDQAAAELLGRYRELVRREIAAFHGAEIRTEGDSFYVVFASVSEAVQAGLAIRDAAADAGGEHPIRVGIGIHAGETTDGEQGIVSSAVNIAARVCDVAEPGEVLVTDTVRSLTRTFLPVAFTARGRRRLKGIAEPITLLRVEHRGATLRTQKLRQRGAVAAGLVVVALVTIALALRAVSTFQGVAASSTASADPSEFGSPSPSASEVAFPNPDETALLDRLPSAVVADCDRADPSGVPTVHESRASGNLIIDRMVPLKVVAGVTCLIGVTRVVFWHAVHASEVDSIFMRRVGLRSVPMGNCGEEPTAWEPWAFGVYRGKLMCSSTPGAAAALEWTYGDEPIYAVAVRRDGEAAALLAWWRDIGRLLGR